MPAFSTFSAWNVSVDIPMLDASSAGVVSSVRAARYPRGIDPTSVITHHVRFDGDGTFNDMDGNRDVLQLAGGRNYLTTAVEEMPAGVVVDGSSSSMSSSSSSFSFSSSSSSSISSSSQSSSSSKYLNVEYERCWLVVK